MGMRSRATNGKAVAEYKENERIRPLTTVRAARGAGSRPQGASSLQERRKSFNIHAGSGAIRRIPA
jgi:hypothetical protein